MKTILSLFVPVLFLLAACSKKESSYTAYHAVVIRTTEACDDYIIRFDQPVASLPKSIGNTYIAPNLPGAFKVDGKGIWLAARPFGPDDRIDSMKFCNGLVQHYPAIWVLSVQ